MRNSRVLLFLIAGLLSFSFSPILVRLAADAPSAAVAALRTLFAVALLTPFAIPKTVGEMRRFSGKEWGLVALAGLLLGLHFIAWIDSIYHTTVASASVLFTTNPLFIAILGLWILNEPIDRPTFIAIVFGVIGASAIALGDASSGLRPNISWGNALATASAFLFACYLIIGRVVRRKTSWLAYVYPLYIVVAITVTTYCLVTGVALTGYGAEIYLFCALMALGPQLLGHGAFNYAVKYMPAAVLGASGLVEPVLAAVWAWLLFNEVPASLSIVGALIVFVALIMVYTGRAARRSLSFDAHSESTLR